MLVCGSGHVYGMWFVFPCAHLFSVWDEFFPSFPLLFILFFFESHERVSPSTCWRILSRRETTMQMWWLTSLKCLMLFLSAIVLQCEPPCQAAAGPTILLQGEPRCIFFTFFALLIKLSLQCKPDKETVCHFTAEISTEVLESSVSLSLGSSA